MTLTLEQYESLIALARAGAKDKVALEQWLKVIEQQNGVVRSFVLVQWQEASAELPAGTKFPTVWPEKLRASIELTTRAICRFDVEQLLKARANEPLTVLVTTDPTGKLGWCTLDQFFK